MLVTCLYSQPCLETSALGFLRMELERLPNVAAFLSVRDAWRRDEESKVVEERRQKTKGSQMAELLGNRAINQKVAGLIPGHANDVVSLDKALHPTCLGGMSLYLL